MNGFEIHLTSLAGRRRRASGATPNQKVNRSPFKPAANLDPHPQAEGHPSSPFHSLMECSPTAFNSHEFHLKFVWRIL
jgi:hypothetical protein